jgi:hypothetical protein
VTSQANAQGVNRHQLRQRDISKRERSIAPVRSDRTINQNKARPAMENRQDDAHRSETLDDKAKPRTSVSTDEQIEQKKSLRRSGEFPPPPEDRDEGIDQEVERDSWDRLKSGPIDGHKPVPE